jgi:hypothetical protein
MVEVGALHGKLDAPRERLFERCYAHCRKHACRKGGANEAWKHLHTRTCRLRIQGENEAAGAAVAAVVAGE